MRANLLWAIPLWTPVLICCDSPSCLTVMMQKPAKKTEVASHALDDAVRLIKDIGVPSELDYDPVSLIRAVNHLQSIGKDRSIKALRRYLDDTSDQERLELIIPLLFEAVEKRRPPVGYFDISVECDIPFNNALIGGWHRSYEREDYQVEWAEKYGRIRTTPLKPGNDPMAAADSFYARHAKDEELRMYLRWQAWRTIAHLLNPEETGSRIEFDRKFPTEQDWNELKKKRDNLRIRWDEKEQEYVK